MRRIVVLGSTGSIGTQTLDVVRQHPDKLKVVGLAVNTRAQDMLAQAKEFGVGHLAVGSEDVAAGESALDLCHVCEILWRRRLARFWDGCRGRLGPIIRG